MRVSEEASKRVSVSWFKKAMGSGCYLLAYSLLAYSLTGCMLATQQDLLKIDSNMTQMRKQQADLVVKMTDLGGNLQALNSQLESSQQRMSSLSQKLDDLQADLSRRLSVLSGQVTGTGQTSTPSSSNPGDMLRLALADYQAAKYELALVGFRNIISQFPKSEVAPQAQFYIGESEFARKNFLDASREYDRMASTYPKSDFAPKALYKKGISFQQLGKQHEAKEAFRELIKEYPRHELVKSAKDILNP